MTGPLDHSQGTLPLFLEDCSSWKYIIPGTVLYIYFTGCPEMILLLYFRHFSLKLLISQKYGVKMNLVTTMNPVKRVDESSFSRT